MNDLGLLLGAIATFTAILILFAYTDTVLDELRRAAPQPSRGKLRKHMQSTIRLWTH